MSRNAVAVAETMAPVVRRSGEAVAIKAMSPNAVDRVRVFERANATLPQTPVVTHHLFHAGMYARTVTVPADHWLTGALIKRASVLIFNGDATVANGEGAERLVGYHVLPASAHRKQAFHTHAETHLTMILPTSAESVDEVEREYTDEADILVSRDGENVVTITGERA